MAAQPILDKTVEFYDQTEETFTLRSIVPEDIYADGLAANSVIQYTTGTFMTAAPLNISQIEGIDLTGAPPGAVLVFDGTQWNAQVSGATVRNFFYSTNSADINTSGAFFLGAARDDITLDGTNAIPLSVSNIGPLDRVNSNTLDLNGNEVGFTNNTGAPYTFTAELSYSARLDNQQGIPQVRIVPVLISGGGTVRSSANTNPSYAVHTVRRAADTYVCRFSGLTLPDGESFGFDIDAPRIGGGQTSSIIQLASVSLHVTSLQ